MNIFYLDPDPVRCSILHCDKHVVKMILEYAQLLSTAHRVLDHVEEDSPFYKESHVNHPSSKWVRSSSRHYEYVYNLFYHLCDEYTFRYGKQHSTDKRLKMVLRYPPKNLPDNGFTPPPQAMPDDSKDMCTVEAYQRYYRIHKRSFAKWTGRDIPNFMEKTDCVEYKQLLLKWEEWATSNCPEESSELINETRNILIIN